jgi:hypothetical protein
MGYWTHISPTSLSPNYSVFITYEWTIKFMHATNHDDFLKKLGGGGGGVWPHKDKKKSDEIKPKGIQV